MGHQVFVSHSSKDKAAADAVCAVLESNGIKCWIAPRDIRAGENWATAILRGITDSRMMVLVFSGHANASEHIRREVERAVHRGIPIAPIRIQDVMPKDDMEYFLSSSHWMDALTPPLEKHLREFSRNVRSLLEIDGAKRVSSPDPVPDAGRPPPLPDTLTQGQNRAPTRLAPVVPTLPPEYDASRRPKKGMSGAKIALIVVGVVLLLMLVLAGTILLPALNRIRQANAKIKSASNLRQIGLAALMYANANQNQFPDSEKTLFKAGQISIDTFVSPRTSTDKPTITDPDAQAQWVNDHSDYVWTGAGLNSTSAGATTVAAYEKPDGQPDGIEVLFADAHVEFITKPQSDAMVSDLSQGKNPPPSIADR